jgi:mannose-6-phosphate isomerase-like protein (cupin superfamily)/CDGSH-type Zn-finger protein
MASPIIAQPKPCLVTLKSGRTYFWCSCGRSAKQPFCDGSHKGTEFEPYKLVATADEEVLLCGCKQTGTPPFCDGAHTNLPGGSPLDDPESAENRKVRLVTERTAARAELNGDCYVVRPTLTEKLNRGSLTYSYLVTGELGALYQTQLLLEAHGDPSPIFGFGDRDVILFIIDGEGKVSLAGREFEVKKTDGVYVRPNETIQLVPTDVSGLRVFALACPIGELQWPENSKQEFDTAYPQRVVSVDAEQRTAMGSRYFQILVDKRIGSKVITQFIGHIPVSKAAPHRHLYEEAIIVLSGEGYMWTEDRKTEVRAGDVIFLPRKQIHSLEATSEDGIDVVGVICPGDNPSINYYD